MFFIHVHELLLSINNILAQNRNAAFNSVLHIEPVMQLFKYISMNTDIIISEYAKPR